MIATIYLILMKLSVILLIAGVSAELPEWLSWASPVVGVVKRIFGPKSESQAPVAANPGPSVQSNPEIHIHNNLSPNIHQGNSQPITTGMNHHQQNDNANTYAPTVISEPYRAINNGYGGPSYHLNSHNSNPHSHGGDPYSSGSYPNQNHGANYPPPHYGASYPLPNHGTSYPPPNHAAYASQHPAYSPGYNYHPNQDRPAYHSPPPNYNSPYHSPNAPQYQNQSPPQSPPNSHTSKTVNINM